MGLFQEGQARLSSPWGAANQAFSAEQEMAAKAGHDGRQSLVSPLVLFGFGEP
jgi:hypothetical protein